MSSRCPAKLSSLAVAFLHLIVNEIISIFCVCFVKERNSSEDAYLCIFLRKLTFLLLSSVK